MSGKGRKKAAAQTNVPRSQEPRSDLSSRPDGSELVGAVEASVQRPQAESPSSEPTERLQVLREFRLFLGQIYRGMTRWLEHDQKHIRVLAWITVLLLLGVFATVVVVIFLKWEPWMTVATIGGLTGITAIGSWIGSRRKPD